MRSTIYSLKWIREFRVVIYFKKRNNINFSLREILKKKDKKIKSIIEWKQLEHVWVFHRWRGYWQNWINEKWKRNRIEETFNFSLNSRWYLIETVHCTNIFNCLKCFIKSAESNLQKNPRRTKGQTGVCYTSYFLGSLSRFPDCVSQAP